MSDLTRVQLVAGGDTRGGKVAEDGTQSKRESSSSFCLPKVYPVVYTPRRAAAPRAERATLWSKMNMWHIWLVSERERGPLRPAVGGSPMCPVLFWRTRHGKGFYGYLPQHTQTYTHTSTPLLLLRIDEPLTIKNALKQSRQPTLRVSFFGKILPRRPPLNVSNQWMCHWEGNTLVEHRLPLLKHTGLWRPLTIMHTRPPPCARLNSKGSLKKNRQSEEAFMLLIIFYL